MERVITELHLRSVVRRWHGEGRRVALVPTMGNLHAGHIQLVHEAKRMADRVVVSIFVNPTQFGEGEDFDAYPRTIEEDSKALLGAGVDLLFLPSVGEMYPEKKAAATFIEVPGMSEKLCGLYRPGHFRGVATVVCKLLNQVMPDLAFFGEKDFQQLSVIQKMVSDLNIPVTIQGIPTVREKNGLALSSRNSYLTVDEHKQAALLYCCLCDAKEAVLAGQKSIQAIENTAIKRLTEGGFELDYFTILNRSDLELVTDKDNKLIILVAARLGTPRLIDNLSFDR